MDKISFISTANFFDIGVLLVFAVFMLLAYQKGLLLSIFNLCSFIISILLTNALYPFVSKFLRNTGNIYDGLKESVIAKMGISEFVGNQTLKAQNELIASLDLPNFLTGSILENNNPEVYKILNVSGIENYIGGFIANMCLNIISMILVFIIVSIIMSVTSQTLNIVSRLPVIDQFNKLGGLLIGFFQGTLFIWIAFVFMNLFLTSPSVRDLYISLDNSFIAKYFYENNLIMDFILRVL